MNKLVDIIIVKYGVPDLERECVESVVQHTDIPYHLTVYDNYPKDENLSVVWNRLIRRSNADYICLLNNDTVVEDKWLKKLIYALESNSAGIVGPITNKCGTHQTDFTKDDKIDKVVKTNVLSGFCMLFPKKIWKEVGGFNEAYHLYAEDSEFVQMVRKKHPLFIHMGVHIFHYGHASTPVAEKRGKNISLIKQQSLETYHKIHDPKKT